MIALRRAILTDAVLFYLLRRDAETRRFLPDFTLPLDLNVHFDWFAANVSAREYYVAEEAMTVDAISGLMGVSVPVRPVGILRVDPDEITGVRRDFVSVIVMPDLRGKGVGTTMLRQLNQGATFWARIHSLNVPSIRAFEKAGFVPAGGEKPWALYRKDA